MEVPQMQQKPGLWTAVGIGIGCMIGSGWLFAAYFAAKAVGPASYITWCIGAGLALILALLLAELASMFKQKALFSRLLVISHDNIDFGFVVAISSWLGMVIVIPAEAAATIQYLSTAYPKMTPYIFYGHEHTLLGSGLIIALIGIYTLINYWGIRSLAKASNIIAVCKFVLPVITAILLLCFSFHPKNITNHGFAPFGVSHIFSGVIDAGIFYAFYGFSMVAMFASELEKPKKNIPRALVMSVLICLLLYLLLQSAFLFSMPEKMLAKGWGNISFTSPFAQLLLLLNVHFLTIWAGVLYFDAAISPSGTGIIYMGSSARTLTGMAHDKQWPEYFAKLHPIFKLSRRSLIFTTVVCALSVLVFKNWQEIMIIVSVFQLISCVAIPIAFHKLRLDRPDIERQYQVKCGKSLSYFIFMLLSYLLTQAMVIALVLALLLHLLFFVIYTLTAYERKVSKMINAFLSSWSIFFYMALALGLAWVFKMNLLGMTLKAVLFTVLFTLSYVLLLRQGKY